MRQKAITVIFITLIVAAFYFVISQNSNKTKDTKQTEYQLKYSLSQDTLFLDTTKIDTVGNSTFTADSLNLQELKIDTTK